MTKEQFLTKIDEMSDTTAKAIREKARKILKTGAFEINEYEDDYRLPKIVMCALCEKMAFQWRPLTESDRKELKNLKHFV